LVFISGLNGGTLILTGNIGHKDYIAWPNGKHIPGRGWTWSTGEGKHDGQITLIHGGVCEADLYLHETLNQLHKEHPNFEYIPCVLNESDTISKASIDTVLLEKLDNIKNDVQLYICGPEETAKKLKTKVFLAGVPSGSIYSDCFISANNHP
jgi:NAD(P)H-flavin reductase